MSVVSGVSVASIERAYLQRMKFSNPLLIESKGLQGSQEARISVGWLSTRSLTTPYRTGFWRP